MPWGSVSACAGAHAVPNRAAVTCLRPHASVRPVVGHKASVSPALPYLIPTRPALVVVLALPMASRGLISHTWGARCLLVESATAAMLALVA